MEESIINDKYLKILDIVKSEVDINNSVLVYYNYLKEYKAKFSEDLNLACKEDLKEFVRGANRYMDEFIFSDNYYSKLRELLIDLYDLLNK